MSLQRAIDLLAHSAPASSNEALTLIKVSSLKEILTLAPEQASLIIHHMNQLKPDLISGFFIQGNDSFLSSKKYNILPALLTNDTSLDVIDVLLQLLQCLPEDELFKIIQADTQESKTSQKRNLLHALFTNSKLTTVLCLITGGSNPLKQLMSLLNRLSSSQISGLLKTTHLDPGNKKCTPLDLILTSTYLSRFFFHEMGERLELIDALLQSSKQKQSALILALSTNNRFGIAALLQYSAKRNQGIDLSLIEQTTNETVRHYASALPILNALETNAPLPDSDNFNNWHAVAALPWNSFQSMLHLAVLNGRVELVKILLDAGADMHAVDDFSNTPLDYALKTGQVDIAIYLIEHPSIRLLIKKSTMQPLFVAILQTANSLLIKTAINVIKNRGIQADEIDAYYTIVTNINPFSSQTSIIDESESDSEATLYFATTDYTDFSNRLDCAGKPGTLHTFLESYCNEAHHWSGQLLQLHSTLQQRMPQQIWLNCLSDIFSQSDNLDETLFTLDKTNAIHTQFIICLFSLPLHQIGSILASIDNKYSVKTMRNIICQSLKRPGIYTRITPEEHRLLNDALTPRQRIELADFYFEHSQLSLLAPETIQFYVRMLDFSQLEKHNKNRLEHTLLIATIEQAMTMQDDIEPDLIQHYFTQLTEELRLIAVQGITNDGLITLLNLVTHEQVKECINTYLEQENETSLLAYHIKQCFINFNSDTPLVPNSFLAELFFDLAKKYPLWQSRQDNPGIIKYLRQLTSAQFNEVLKAWHVTLHPNIILNSVLSPEPELTHYLYSIASHAKRAPLIPVIDAAQLILKQADEAVAFFEHLNLLVHEQLVSLITSLHQLISEIEHLRTGELNDASSIVPFITHIQTQTASLTTLLHTENDLFGLFEIDRTIYQLTDNLLEQAIPHFLIQVENLTNSIGLQIENDNQQILLTADMHVYSEQLNFDIQWLSSIVSESLVNNPRINQLIPMVIQWQLAQGYTCDNNTLYDNIRLATIHCSAEVTDSLIAEQDPILELENQASPLLRVLNRLKGQPLSTQTLFNRLKTNSKNTLSALIQLSHSIGLEGLYRITSLVFDAKQYNHPLQERFLQTALNEHVLSTWLSQQLSYINQYTSTVRAVQALLCSTFLEGVHNLGSLHALLLKQNAPLHPLAIIQLTQSYLPMLQDGSQHQSISQLIQVIIELLTPFNYDQKIKLINALSAQFLQLITDKCLMGLGSTDDNQASTCKQLLTLLCSSIESNPVIEAIKHQLGAQNLNCLNNPTLQNIAQGILQEASSTQDMTIDGVWIQRLILSPRFIAQANEQLLAQLVERYRALSLTLKQDEYQRLNQLLSDKLLFSDNKWSRLQEKLLNNKASRNNLLKKRSALLTFRADDSISALFKQLDENCHHYQQQNPQEAQQAVAVLNRYYLTHLQDMRGDFIIKAADYFYKKAFHRRGDLSSNVLLDYIKKHVPHYNFIQNELVRKTRSHLYNNRCTYIGFINEGNEALTLVKNKLVRLIDTGFLPGFVVYDSHRIRIGTLSDDGQVIHDNIFTKNTSAYLVGTMPKEALASSKTGCQLLFTDVMQSQALDILYQQITDDSKKEWIDQQVMRQIQSTSKEMTMVTHQQIVTYLPFDLIRAGLLLCSNQINAENLFLSLLQSDEKRAQLLAPENRVNILEFLEKHFSRSLMDTFLLNFHAKSWFPSALELFGDYAQKSRNPALLAQALATLNQQFNHQKVKTATYDAILCALIHHEHAAFVVLNSFLPTNTMKRDEQITSYFYKYHLIPVLNQLNQQTSWYGSAQYQLILTILKTEREWLFPRHEPRHSKKFGWRENDIVTLSQFLNRHIHINQPVDDEHHLGQQLLNELVLRAAHYGRTDFFYTMHHQFDRTIAHFKMARQAFMQQRSRLRKFFESQAVNHRTTNWNAIATEAFDSLGNELYLLVAFVMNYSGSTTALMQLLDDALTVVGTERTDYAEQLSEIIAKFPARDVSKTIFLALERAAAHNPALINQVVLNNLAHFYTFNETKQIKRDTAKNDNLIKLLTHFGNQKHYALTQHCATLITQQERVQDILHQTHKIRKIAAVEHGLQNKLHKIFYVLSAFMIRLWHYGFRGLFANNDIVTFCENHPKIESNPIIPDEKISATIIDGQSVDKSAPDVIRLAARQQLADTTRLASHYQSRLISLKTLNSNPGFFTRSPIEIINSDDEYNADQSSINESAVTL